MHQVLVKTTLRSIQRAPQRALLIAALAIHVVWLLAGVGAASAQSGAAAVAPTGQLPVFRANNPPLHAHEKAPQSFPEAALRGDAGGRSAH